MKKTHANDNIKYMYTVPKVEEKSAKKERERRLYIVELREDQKYE